jgi:hypothetical protein
MPICNNTDKDAGTILRTRRDAAETGARGSGSTRSNATGASRSTE